MSVRGKGQDLGHQWWGHPLVSVQQEVLVVGCSAPAAFPPLDLEFSTIFTLILWCSDEPVFCVSEVLSWQQMEHKASSTPIGS